MRTSFSTLEVFAHIHVNELNRLASLFTIAELSGEVLRIFLELASEGSIKDALNEFGKCVIVWLSLFFIVSAIFIRAVCGRTATNLYS